MPIYEYICDKCNAVTERERAAADRKKVVVCDSCGSRKTTLMISLCDFTLKGDSWASSGYGTRTSGKKKKP